MDLHHLDADVVLIGGGIMSATLGSLLTVLEPNWRIVVLERESDVATESSAAWNNAGTGHTGACELNYMPDPHDGSRAEAVAREFRASREWWNFLSEQQVLTDTEFVRTTPHLSVVFGHDDVSYLRARHATLTGTTQFEAMEYTEDPARIAAWAPLITDGRTPDEPIAATRFADGTDVDFGELTRRLTDAVVGSGGSLLTGHEVRSLVRSSDGRWTVSGRSSDGTFVVTGRHVFVGAGGQALRLLQKAKLPEILGYGVLPVGAAFYRCSAPEVVDRHDAKVYGRAASGAPPMSLPHLDRRHIDGTAHLMFGPYATFSTKLLRHGRISDFFATVNRHNVRVLAGALIRNLPLVRYLVVQLLSGRRTKFAQLRRYYPDADPRQWELAPAGQRAQLVAPGPDGVGEIRQGTEVIVGADGTVSALLGASPGASTAVTTMLDVLRRSFPEHWPDWSETVATAVPSYPRFPREP